MRDAEGALASDGAAAGIQIKALAVAHLSGSDVLQMFLGRIAFSRKPKGGPQSLLTARHDGHLRIGLLTVKTGPLVQGGIQMEQGIALFLKDHNNVIAGRNVELMVGDTDGSPADAKIKAQAR